MKKLESTLEKMGWVSEPFRRVVGIFQDIHGVWTKGEDVIVVGKSCGEIAAYLEGEYMLNIDSLMEGDIEPVAPLIGGSFDDTPIENLGDMKVGGDYYEEAFRLTNT